jgi:hypothetical protein
VVEDLLHPERFPEVEEDVVCRYYSLGTIREDSPACGRDAGSIA